MRIDLAKVYAEHSCPELVNAHSHEGQDIQWVNLRWAEYRFISVPDSVAYLTSWASPSVCPSTSTRTEDGDEVLRISTVECETDLYAPHPRDLFHLQS